MYHWKVELLELTRVSPEEGQPGLSSFRDLSTGLNSIDSPDSISWASQDPKLPWEAEAPTPGLAVVLLEPSGCQESNPGWTQTRQYSLSSPRFLPTFCPSLPLTRPLSQPRLKEGTPKSEE